LSVKAPTVYLALRVVPPPGFWQGLFAALTRWRLVTAYPHAGVVVDGQLVHSTLANGVHKDIYNLSHWLLLPITTPVDAVRERIGHRMGFPYDPFSLLAFVLPLSVRWSKGDYCFEFCWYVLTGQKSTGLVTAEQLLAVAAQQMAAKQ
jgi:hypothetical protein